MNIDTHLGSGKNYEKYYKIEPSLLVAIPRSINREKNDIVSPFKGMDVWHCYEFSALRWSGFPIVGMLKIAYSSESTHIVESKSLKLYLNSWNFEKLPQAGLQEDIVYIQSMIKADLSRVLETNVLCQFHSECDSTLPPIKGKFEDIDDYFINSNIVFESSKKFEGYEAEIEPDEVEPQFFHTRVLRSNCLITNQPDYADLYVYLLGQNYLLPESLINFILSLRDENHFHEEIVEILYDRLFYCLNPDELFVGALYTRRGGIDINPVRASSDDLIKKITTNLTSIELLTTKSIRH